MIDGDPEWVFEYDWYGDTVETYLNGDLIESVPVEEFSFGGPDG